MKLIATDLDGTLLNELGDISSENIQAIQKALDKGIQVVVATGRSYESAKRPITNAGLSLPVICLNGAMTYNEHGELIKEIPMDRHIVQQIQQCCQRENLYYEIFSQQKSHSVGREAFKQVFIDIAKTANPLIPPEEISQRATQRLQNEEVEMTEDFDALFDDPTLHFYKLLAFSLDKDVLTNVAREFQEEPTISITASGDINIEFNHIDAQKGVAVREFAANLGIDMKEVMALGDHFNDESMLRIAGRAIAMGNADEAIKKIATHTTKSNAEHGVAHAIENMLTERT